MPGPKVIVLGGVNGAGKSTAAHDLLADTLEVDCFVNADLIARGLNALQPQTVAAEAGRVMLARLRGLANSRANFAFETTLAGRSYLPFLRQLRRTGFAVEIHYFWLESPDLAVARVRERVRAGGHDVPENTIRDRYRKSLRHFWREYRLEADAWFVYDNSGWESQLFGCGSDGDEPLIDNLERWQRFRSEAENA